MKNFKILLAALTILLIVSFKSDDLPKSFMNLLERANMTFIKPDGLIETKIIENRQMNYEFAIKYPNKKFEIRYAIRPLDFLIRDYNEKEKNKKPGDINIHPNKLYSTVLQATVLNISGGQLPEIQEFDKQAVKSEFNADWGATTFVEVGQEFGQDYKYCIVVALHKDNLADAYYFYLSDSKADFDKSMAPVFHSLIFK